MNDTNGLAIARTDAHVREVAAALPFPVQLEADMGADWMGGSNALQIDLGTRGAEDDPHDRAGIGPERGAAWWIETGGGERVEISTYSASADPAEIAAWLAATAREFGSPAAIARPDWADVCAWADSQDKR